MKTQVALHRVQDLSGAVAKLEAANKLSGDVEAYLEFRQAQMDAVEDGETSLASSIGKHMRAIREQYPAHQWNQAISKLDN